jgi:arginine/ornithine N-succinyltransferase beta subunit
MGSNEHHQQFAADMEETGYEVRDYQGRFYYSGPAVEVDRDELQDVIRATSVPLQWDNMGKTNLVVYPK